MKGDEEFFFRHGNQLTFFHLLFQKDNPYNKHFGLSFIDSELNIQFSSPARLIIVPFATKFTLREKFPNMEQRSLRIWTSCATVLTLFHTEFC